MTVDMVGHGLPFVPTTIAMTGHQMQQVSID
jgi:hypothetical protein